MIGGHLMHSPELKLCFCHNIILAETSNSDEFIPIFNNDHLEIKNSIDFVIVTLYRSLTTDDTERFLLEELILLDLS